MTKYALLGLVGFLALSACDAPVSAGGEPVQDGEYTWLQRNARGFDVIVPSDFPAQNMRSEFGDYCKQYNAVTRSLKLENDEQGRRVVGACLRA